MVQAMMLASQRHNATIHTQRFSILTHNFNLLWSEALNVRREEPLDFFVMVHSDVDPEPGWLDKLIDEQAKWRADVLSAVIAIKDDAGETSTAVYDPRTDERRRLTLEEVWALPVKTFDGSLFGRALLVNTGLMLVNMHAPWVEQLHFHTDDWIRRTSDGTFVAECMPEDWSFSLDARALGAKVMATSAIDVGHFGASDTATNHQRESPR